MNSNHYDSDLSVNDCLAALLGLNFQHIRKGHHDCLLDEIEENLSHAVDALDRGLPPQSLEDLDALTKRADRLSNRYAQAITYHTRIVGEVARHRAKQSADLVVTQDKDHESGRCHQVRISRQSFIDWALQEFQLELTSDDLSIQEPLANSDLIKNSRKYTDLEQDKHQVIIAILVEELSRSLKGKYRNGEKPNFDQIAKHLEQELEKQGVSMSGLSSQTMKKKFSAYRSTMLDFVESKK